VRLIIHHHLRNLRGYAPREHPRQVLPLYASQSARTGEPECGSVLGVGDVLRERRLQRERLRRARVGLIRSTRPFR